MVYTLDLLQIGFICFLTALITILFIVIFEPKLYITERKSFITKALNGLWIGGAIFLIYIITSLTPYLPCFLAIEENKTMLLSSVGIILSAFIASATVMKNIENANNLEKEKIKRELFDRRKKAIFTISDLMYYFMLHVNFSKKFLKESKLHNRNTFLDILYNQYNEFSFKHKDHIEYIKVMINSLEDVEFIFEKNDRIKFEPIQALLLEYLIQLHDSGDVSEVTFKTENQLLKLLKEFGVHQHESIQLV